MLNANLLLTNQWNEPLKYISAPINNKIIIPTFDLTSISDCGPQSEILVKSHNYYDFFLAERVRIFGENIVLHGLGLRESFNSYNYQEICYEQGFDIGSGK